MIRSKTVFIIGAGASNEVGLPIGKELRNTIASKLNFEFDDFGRHLIKGDRTIFTLFQQKYARSLQNGVMTYIQRSIDACQHICKGIFLAASIDDFIHAQNDLAIAECSKLAIVSSILEAERKSKIYYAKKNAADTVDFQSIQDTWYIKFFHLLTQQVTKTNLSDTFNNVTLINFNYDRCIEHFLVHAISEFYKLPFDEASELIAKIRMFRPYGSVGPYFGSPGEVVEFGTERIPPFEKIVSSIKTYTEQIEDKDSLSKMQKAVAEARVLVFLGNAFHKNNMTLLNGGYEKEKDMYVVGKKFYATRKGISDSDLLVVNQEFNRLCKQKVNINYEVDALYAEECNKLFDTYHMSLRG